MSSVTEAVARQREARGKGALRTVRDRLEALRAMRRMVDEGGDLLAEAIGRDLGRCWLEAWGSEPGLVLADISRVLRRLRGWSRGRRYPLSPLMLPGRARGERVPYGVAGIIGPWNYPAGLLLSPAVSALAAGNTVVLKPSERAPETADALARLVAGHLPPEQVTVVTGESDVAKALVDLSDVVVFTGSVPVGRLVMERAGRRPVPVVLELGGVNPCYVAADADLGRAAERIAWGKFFAAGQTCLAPNHVWVERPAFEPFLERMRETVERFYGSDPQASPDYGRIIDRRALERLEPMLSEGEAVTGGSADAEDLYVAPTVLRGVDRGSRLLSEEIFGPILPVLPCGAPEREMRRVQGDGLPLIVYGFSRSTRRMESMLRELTDSGSVCVNGTLHRVASSAIPFGGAGSSGLGRYRGYGGYLELGRERAMVRKSPRFEMPMLYPPYRIGRKLVRLLGRFM